MSNVIKVDLSIIARAIRLCLIANIVIAVWGRRGWGKTSIFQQACPKGWEYFPFYTSDKEPQDIGGLPFPVERLLAAAKKGDKAMTVREVEYLMTRLLPFDCVKKCLVVFEEFDRA